MLRPSPAVFARATAAGHASISGLAEVSPMQLLSFLAAPGFVVPWYLFGLAAAAWVWRDLRLVNTPPMTAMKWAWPIVVLFFSVLGLGLYFAAGRAPGIAHASSPEQKQQLHDVFERSMLRRVNGAVIHCVAGDGLGIMSAMVLARVLELSFWQEFWFEYAVGFAFGWLIFQFKSMTMMTDSKARALAMAFRAEFFSMLTVMGGMGAVMAYVTPAVVGMQPKPTTAAFWGFGMFGLLVGYLFTFPMNWMIVKIGWKHGMGAPEDARPVHERRAKFELLGAMGALGLAALILPGALVVARERHEAQVADLAVAEFAGDAALAGGSGAIERGLQASVRTARGALAHGNRRDAVAALDNALRAAQVARVAALPPGPQAEQTVRHARRALQNGDAAKAQAVLRQAAAADPDEGAPAGRVGAPSAYEGAPLLDAAGSVIGEVRRVQPDRALVAFGGVHDFWGFLDLGHPVLAWVPVTQLVRGPARALGKTYAMLPTLQQGVPGSASIAAR
jgi:hypothetical protein